MSLNLFWASPPRRRGELRCGGLRRWRTGQGPAAQLNHSGSQDLDKQAACRHRCGGGCGVQLVPGGSEDAESAQYRHYGGQRPTFQRVWGAPSSPALKSELPSVFHRLWLAPSRLPPTSDSPIPLPPRLSESFIKLPPPFELPPIDPLQSDSTESIYSVYPIDRFIFNMEGLRQTFQRCKAQGRVSLCCFPWSRAPRSQSRGPRGRHRHRRDGAQEY